MDDMDAVVAEELVGTTSNATLVVEDLAEDLLLIERKD